LRDIITIVFAYEEGGRGMESKEALGEYVCILAQEDGVNIIGMTRGKDTKFHHTEKLDRGEVMIAQFTEQTSAMKIKGRARIFTAHGVVESGD